MTAHAWLIAGAITAANLILIHFVFRDGYRKGRLFGFGRGYLAGREAADRDHAQAQQASDAAAMDEALATVATPQDGSLAFAEALLSGALREPVGEDADR